MPDSFQKRQRDRAKAQKATEKEERRQARKQAKAERTGGESDWLADPIDPLADDPAPPRERPDASRAQE